MYDKNGGAHIWKEESQRSMNKYRIDWSLEGQHYNRIKQFHELSCTIYWEKLSKFTNWPIISLLLSNDVVFVE